MNNPKSRRPMSAETKRKLSDAMKRRHASKRIGTAVLAFDPTVAKKTVHPLPTIQQVQRELKTIFDGRVKLCVFDTKDALAMTGTYHLVSNFVAELCIKLGLKNEGEE